MRCQTTCGFNHVTSGQTSIGKPQLGMVYESLWHWLYLILPMSCEHISHMFIHFRIIFICDSLYCNPKKDRTVFLRFFEYNVDTFLSFLVVAIYKHLVWEGFLFPSRDIRTSPKPFTRWNIASGSGRATSPPVPR